MKTLLLCSCLLMAFLSIQISTKAQQATLNTNFGDSGVAQVPAQDYEEVFPVSTVLQNSKILSSGIAIRDEYGYTSSITRLNADGSIDASFGTGGSIYVCNNAYACFLRSYTLQPDGKIVTLSNTSPHYDYPIDQIWLERFLPNGKPDSTFGTNGAVIIAKSDRFDEFDVSPKSLAIKPDGKIVISTFKDGVFYIGQFFSSGVPDNTFGVGGTITSTTPYDNNISNIIALSDNKLIATSTYLKTDGTYGTDLIRYTAKGKIDSTFGVNGVALLGNTNNNISGLTGLAIQNNKLLVYTEDANVNVIYRCFANGSIDNSFGTSGKAYGDAVTGAAARIIKLQSNNKIIINNTSSYKLERFLTNGTVDNSFGVSGLLDVSLAANNAFDVNNNQIAVTGASYDYTNHYPVLQVVSYVPCNSCLASSSQSNAIAKSIDTKITVYPNPVKNVVNINGLSDKGANHLTLSNNAGAIMQQISTANTSYSWNISNLKAGIYFIQVQTADAKTFSFKIVKE